MSENKAEMRAPEERFSVGEIALGISTQGRGMQEVAIEALPQPAAWISRNGKSMPAGAYLISNAGKFYRCWPSQLLKRPPSTASNGLSNSMVHS